MASRQSLKRADGRTASQLRKVKIQTKVNRYAEGSCLFKMGNTEVLCLASVEEDLPPWRKEMEEGWVTSEYAMLPRATHTRSKRESVKGKLGGRTQEISRLVGRALRSVTDLKRLGPRTITIDCEVLQADGGTRCASISGGYIALAEACKKLQKSGLIKEQPLIQTVAAVSVGMLGKQALLDLAYEEDVRADVDMNVVMTGGGKLVELQGTAEQTPFSMTQANQMMKLAARGIAELTRIQMKVLKI